MCKKWTFSNLCTEAVAIFCCLGSNLPHSSSHHATLLCHVVSFLMSIKNITGCNAFLVFELHPAHYTSLSALSHTHEILACFWTICISVFSLHSLPNLKLYVHTVWHLPVNRYIHDLSLFVNYTYLLFMTLLSV